MSHGPDPRIEQYRAAAEAMGSGEFGIELSVEPPDEVGALGIALTHLAETMEQRFTELKAVHAIGEHVAAGLLLDDVCDRVYEAFVDLIPYDRIGLALLDDPQESVTARWARSDGAAPRLRKGYTAPLAGSSLAAVLETGTPRILNDLEVYLEEHPTSRSTRLILAEGVRSSLTCPLVVRGNAVGFLFFSSRRPDTYADAHVQVFQEIAGQLSAVVEKTRLYEEVLELNQVKNHFLGMAAHDMRSPLTVIDGWIDMLLSGYPVAVAPEVAPILGHVQGAAEQLLALVEELLDLSVIESGELVLHQENVELGQRLTAWHHSAVMLGRAKGIEVVLDLPDEPVVVWADPLRFDQTIGNLGTNALKFSRPGTTVHARLRTRGGRAVVSVQDEGVGIAADELPRLFTAFGRTSARPTGGERSTGLGLAITRRVVEAHGGTIHAESELGVGSTFEVELPLREGGSNHAS